MTLPEIQSQIRSKQTNCETLVEEAITRIEEKKELRAFITVAYGTAREQAIKVDKKIKQI